jgi:protein-L-isoaspartate O-methyltransferase
VPRPLLEQLAIGGRLVIPIGDRDRQVLNLVTRRDEASYETTTLGDVRFVPLIGEHGFQSQQRET